MLRALPLVSVRQQHHDARAPLPLLLSRGDEVVEDEDEVVELEPSKKKDEEDKSIKILSESPKAVEEKSSK